MWSCTASQVLTHVALLKPALQAWCGVWGCRDQVLAHLALLKPAPQAWWGCFGGRDQVLTHLALLRSALQAWWGPQGLVLLVRLARVCDSSLKRSFPVAQGAAIVITPFAGGMVQMNVSRNRPPRGQRPGTTWPRASPEGLGAELPNLFLYSQPMLSPITGFQLRAENDEFPARQWRNAIDNTPYYG